MGQRQSSPEQEYSSENNQDESNEIRARPTLRPASRVQWQRDTLRSAVIPVNDVQRREERRLRRERLRGQQSNTEEIDFLSTVSAAMVALNSRPSTTPMTPFSSMIASFISEAVMTSFRNESIPEQQLTMRLPPEIFQQMEPGGTEDVFVRIMRLPVVVTSVRGATQEGEVTRAVVMPILLYGIRTPTEETSVTSPVRRSERIRAQTQAPLPRQTILGEGQWTVYVISGNSLDGVLSETPSYEELLSLAAMIGPARNPTISQEAIDQHVPMVKYSEQVKQGMVGNSDGCQICLNDYLSSQDVRVLPCLHGFCVACIDNWLTKYKNQCPLCRKQPIPSEAVTED